MDRTKHNPEVKKYLWTLQFSQDIAHHRCIRCHCEGVDNAMCENCKRESGYEEEL